MLNALQLAAKHTIINTSAILMLAACASTKSSSSADVGNDEYREAIGVFSDPQVDAGMDPIASAAFWGTRYNTDQSNPDVAVRFSKSLRKIGSNDEAVGVMQKITTQHPENAAVNLEYGKVLVQSGRAFEAVRFLEAAVAKTPSDWRALSAYGVALDQIGEHEAARSKYDRALAMSPGEVMVTNNKGLSYALEGNLSMARVTLRQAATRPGADSRVRQNLALVMALSGKMAEAERLARSDLPPIVADNNIDVYRQLMNQPAYWEEYASGDVETPDFDNVPAAPLSPSPKPQLREEQQPDNDENSDGAPVALIEVAPVNPVTNASAGVELKKDEE
ncbi:tetratricopeptide repeat protein [Hyphococcus flavus]|uniref:Tetratricopeptide repeat protein n=1 Tax=Hyphococcus flavus TaxID=1866326 RepID=A0AAE9ZI46_9PROT|nr:tetratricopeptide repeat protein [Hyphococcus flavus]WDI33052.1 tetratricopeptide repeat protein [Hyphococcus flavus]